LQCEAAGAGAGYEFADQLIQAAGAVVVVHWRTLSRDEGAGALLGVEDASDFELSIGPQDGVGVDGEVDGDLADSRELVSHCERASGEASLHLIDELTINRDATAVIESESEERLRYHKTNVLVY
jgi:hypothetical protein